MKKIITLVSFVSLSVFVQAQSGDGSAGNPFYGTIATSVHWTVTSPGTTVYIGTPTNSDLTIGTNGHLTIDPGITVIFTQLNSDLLISGTGQITAGGPGSQVKFTKDTSKSNWGHISFQSMDVSAGLSTLDNCIIEYGDVRSNSGSAKYGGGIYADFSNLTIKNSTIQHNKAEWGGGIFVNEDEYPGIENCIIYDNYSKEGGGGIYLWNRAKSVIKNCIFQANHCDGTSFSFYSGGGLGSQSSGSIKVVNCTFANNTSSRTSGQSIMLYASISNTIINCIVWGNTGNHFFISGTNTIQYSAVQGTIPTGTGNFVLNSLNTGSNPAGPYFADPSTSDWRLQPLSPCRDSGTDSYPGVTIPLLDFAGNSRVRTTDIGAYENILSSWKITAFSADWTSDGNWDGGVPTSTSEVIIPSGAANYPTGSTTQDFTIGAGKFMTLEPGSRLTLNALTNNGVVRLNSSAAGFASLILNSYTRGAGGTEEIQLFLTGGGTTETYKWHYISTPVSSLDVSVFAPGETYNLAHWVENRPTGSLLEGWVAYDGYIYSSGTMGGPQFSTLIPGKGYDYYDNADNTFTFGGNFNTTDVTMDLGYNGTPSIHGFNLLGNPFSSGLDWDYIITHSYPASTSKSLYFTRDNKQCTYASGVGIPAGVTGIIPPMQGFFTKTYSTGNSITLPAAARTQINIHDRYKGKATIPLVRLSITDNSMTDETVIRFDTEAKADLDFDFDAVKMFISASDTYIYSVVSGTNYAINGQPFPEDSLKIPVVVNVTTTGSHIISATQLQGLDSYNVSLIDKSNSISTDLKKTPQFTFTSSAGTLTDRFVLNISKIATGIEIPMYQENKLNIYHSPGFVNIQALSDEWTGKTCSVRILDLTGKTVKDVRNLEFDNNSLLRISSSGLKGIYFVEVRAGALRHVGKVVIR